MNADILQRLAVLPPLWSTEARDTDDLALPLRLASRWHRLVWYPVERDGDVLFGLTLVTTPEWRHFHIAELHRAYSGFSVALDPTHVSQRVPRVPEIATYCFDDLTPFSPSRPKVWP